MTPNQPRIPAGAASSQRPQAARLLEILEASRAFHVQLLASVRARRDAVRTANFAELERLQKGEAAVARSLAELEHARITESTQLAVRLALPPKATLADIASRLAEPERARLDLVRSELRRTIEETARETGVVRQATERLSAHMAGIMQTVNSALAHAKVYSRGGVIAMGPNVVSSLDIKS
jgi:hypothetical protein